MCTPITSRPENSASCRSTFRSLRLRGSGSRFAPCAFGLGRLLSELEADLPVVQFQVRGKRPPFLGDKARKQIGFASGDEFLDLILRDLPTQNRLAQPESAGLGIGQRVLTGESAR